MTGKKNRARITGFTLIELVVVIFIISVLSVLVLSGIQASREMARAAQCKNNLKQIGIGLMTYHSAVNSFPPGGNGGVSYSFHSMILPYIDQVNLYNAINFSDRSLIRQWKSSSNATACKTQIAVMLCPTDGEAGRSTQSFARTNYAGNQGSGIQSYGFNGIFTPGDYAPISLSHIVDGSSMTAALSEWVVGSKDKRATTFNTDIPYFAPSELDEFSVECETKTEMKTKIAVNDKGAPWMHGDYKHTIYNHVLSTNKRSCLNYGLLAEGAWTSGSMHNNGSHVAFSDGHVSFVRDGMSNVVWRSIGSRNGSEVIENPF